MNLATASVLWSLVGGTIWLTVLALRRWEVLAVAPSIVWSGIMTVPFLLTGPWDPQAAQTQALGIGIVGAAILCGDLFFVFRAAHDSEIKTLDGSSRNYWISIGALLLPTTALAAWHLSAMPRIPVIEQLFGTGSELDVAVLREASSKQLGVPLMVQWALNWVGFAAPALICGLLVMGRHHVWVFIVWTATAAYAVSTAARWPLLLVTLVVGAMCVYSMPRHRMKQMAKILGITSLFAIFFLAYATIWHPSGTVPVIRRLGHPKTSGEQPYTVSDQLRSGDGQARLKETSLPVRIANKFVYRVMLTPIDVSHRWYLFFPAHNQGRFLGWRRTIEDPITKRQSHAANAVGRWAYTRRFPGNYLESVCAYGSVDADAYGHFGVIGICVAGVGVLLLRILMTEIGVRLPGVRIMLIPCVILYALSLPQASLQALLVSHGLAPLLALTAVMGWLLRRKWIRERKDALAVQSSPARFELPPAAGDR